MPPAFTLCAIMPKYAGLWPKAVTISCIRNFTAEGVVFGRGGGTLDRNRTCNWPLGGARYIHLTTKASEKGNFTAKLPL